MENFIEQMAIDLLESLKETYEWSEEENRAIDVAIDALEKQIPLEVEEIYLHEYFCPSCYSENGADEGRVEDCYCHACGQRLEVE
ncbi:hypothetical protein M2140_000060 [Clostridiales Family XIII bacterium PM5-7]